MKPDERHTQDELENMPTVDLLRPLPADSDGTEIGQLKVTPQHRLKPRLEWVGRLLGADLYIDLMLDPQPEERRKLAEEILKNAIDKLAPGKE